MCILFGSVIPSGAPEARSRGIPTRERKEIRPDLIDTVEEILARLDETETPQGMNLPGYRLHRLKGDLSDFWAVTVRANWRIIFRFEDQDAYDVELIDYH